MFTSMVMASPDENQSIPQTQVQDEGGMFERSVASLINGIVVVFQKLEEVGNFKTLDKLVFNNCISEQDKEMNPFSSYDWDKLKRWYVGMTAATGGFALFAVILSSYKLMMAGAFNPMARKEAMESMWRWLGAIALIAGASAMFFVVFNINNALVDALQIVAANVGGKSSSADLSGLSLTGDSVITNLTTGSVLGTAFVKLVFCGIEGWLNVIYEMRRVALMTIYVFTPLMAWMWAINKNVNAYSIWFGELLSNAFMQSAHALCILIFLTFCDVKQGTTWFNLLIWLAIILPLSEMLRNSVQGIFTRMAGFDEAGAASKVMGVMGFGSAIGMGNLASTAMPMKLPSPGAGSTNTPGIKPEAMPGGNASSPVMTGGFPSPIATMAAGATGNIGGPAGGHAMGPPGVPGIGGKAGTNVPPGYSTTQSGLAVPSSTARSNQSNSINQSAPGPHQNNSPGLGMVRAANLARTAAGVTGALAGATAGVMFSAVPGGKEVAGMAARGVAGIAGAAVSAGSIARQTVDTYRNNDGYTIGQSFREVTGSQTNMEAIKKSAGVTATEGITPIVAQNRKQATGMADNMLQNIVPTVDGHRWR